MRPKRPDLNHLIIKWGTQCLSAAPDIRTKVCDVGVMKQWWNETHSVRTTMWHWRSDRSMSLSCLWASSVCLFTFSARLVGRIALVGLSFLSHVCIRVNTRRIRLGAYSNFVRPSSVCPSIRSSVRIPYCVKTARPLAIGRFKIAKND